MSESSPLCSTSDIWSTVVCVIEQTAVFARDAAVFTARTSLVKGEEIAHFIADIPSPRIYLAWLGTFVSTAAARGVQLWNEAIERAGLENAWQQASGILNEALDTWRDGFARTFPDQAHHVADQAALAATCVWLILCVFLFLKGVFAVRACCRRQRRNVVMFFPDKSGANVGRICKELSSARRRVWLAMYTLTDDGLANEVLRAHARGLDVRLIADDDQSDIPGSDVVRLKEAGVPVVYDHSHVRMHHKFAVVDDVLLSGSFNWTNMASKGNFENLVIMYDRHTVESFKREFDQLWSDFYHRTGRKTRTLLRSVNALTPVRKKALNASGM